MVKIFKADTCASKSVAICRERMTKSRLLTFFPNEKPKDQSFFWSGTMSVITRPRFCSESIATSIEPASIEPAWRVPEVSMAL